MNDLPRSVRTRATPTVERKSCGAKDEPVGPGRITRPPPRSSPARNVYDDEPIFPVARPPHSGEVIVRVYTAWIGVSNRSTPSRKKGRFSGKKSAKRLFTAIWATSASTWEKSGRIAASNAAFVPKFHLMSTPMSVSCCWGPRGAPTVGAVATLCTATYGATTMWFVEGGS